MATDLQVFLIKPSDIVVYSFDHGPDNYIYNAGTLDRIQDEEITSYVQIQGSVTSDFQTNPVVLGYANGVFEVIYAPTDMNYLFKSDGSLAKHGNSPVMTKSMLKIPNFETSPTNSDRFACIELSPANSNSIQEYAKMSRRGEEYKGQENFEDMCEKSLPEVRTTLPNNARNTPSVYGVSNSRNVPTTFNASNIPTTFNASNVPIQPSSGSVPTTFNASNVPIQPSSGSVPIQPSSGNVPTTFNASSVPTTFNASSVPIQPSSGNVPTQPSSGNVPTQPAVSTKHFKTSDNIESSSMINSELTNKVEKLQKEIVKVKAAEEELRGVVKALIQRLYEINSPSIVLPPSIKVDGKDPEIVSVEKIQEILNNGDIEKMETDPLLQPYGGGHRTNDRYLTFYGKNGNLYLVRANYDPKKNKLHDPKH